MITLYRSPSHMSNEFEEFLANLGKHISNIFSGHSNFVLLISDFNVKSRNWPNHDITAMEGAQLNSLLTPFRIKQWIMEPTYILENMSSCMDLIFTNQPNIILDSIVHSLLYSKCHQII